MLKIGEFSSLSGISIVMLRHYDKIELLVPKHIDRINGYRYYDKDQLVIANQIVAMKSMGFGLDEIKQSFRLSREELQKLFVKKIEEKKEEQQRIRGQLHILENTIQIEENDEKQFALRVVKKTIPSTYAITYRRTIHTYPEEGRLWQEMIGILASKRIVIAEDSLSGSRWLGREEMTGTIDIEIMLFIDHPLENIEPLVCKKLESCVVASILFQGSYLQINKINMVVAQWIDVNHYEIIGEPFALYHKSPKDDPDENTYLTEVCFPIKSTKKF